MSGPSATVVIPTLGDERLGRVLASLAGQSVAHQTLVVDNGSGRAKALAAERLPAAEVLELPANAGFTGAVNRGVQRADGEIAILLNDDCVVDPDFVAALCASLDPAAGIGMAAAVMRDWREPSLIDSAGMELDRTLLVFDYLNGEPLEVLDGPVADPIGPSAAAAAFDRATFLGAGGFDERLFAYWEDVDLVLRLRRDGVRCALAPGARGDHEHSATLGSGSARKNYLMGYGRGYVLRKWRVLPRRLGPVLAREVPLCAGQAVLDRNLAGVRGRIEGYRAAAPSERYPAGLPLGAPGGFASTLARRARRRARIRGGARGEGRDALAVLHLAGTSGPSRSLEAELAWLAGRGSLTVIVPGPGRAADAVSGFADVVVGDYGPLTVPAGGAVAAAGAAAGLARDVRSFRRRIRAARPDLVVVVTGMLPAAVIAARRERVPVLVYAGELLGEPAAGPMRRVAGRALVALTGRLADGIIACSEAVAATYGGARSPVEVVYPPIADHSGGDGSSLRARLGIPADAPLLASVGNLTPGRGQDVLVRATAALLRTHPEARLVIAGEPLPRAGDLAFTNRVGDLARELGVGDRVVLAGHLEPIADLYAAADLVVNPARVPESFGRVAFEAATAGTPAVVTAVGAAGELLADRESVLLVAPDDPEAITRAAERLIADRALGQRLAAGAAAIVAERLRPELSLAGFRRAVERLPARSARRGWS